MKQFLTIFLILYSMTALKTQSAVALDAFKAATFVSSSGDTLPYRILWPKGYSDEDGAERFPVVLFLHGAGERGNDNQLQLTHGTPLFLNAQEEYPAIVVIPQCSADDYWAQMVKTADNKREYNFDETPNPSLSAVAQLMDHLIATEKVDTNRIYLMGLSMGGMGTFELLARRPNTFAAAVAICGGTNPALTPIYSKKVPLWIFHGAEDVVVNVEESRRVVKALADQGVDCKYTEYPGVNHNSWDNAFAEPDLMQWLFMQRQG